MFNVKLVFNYFFFIIRREIASLAGGHIIGNLNTSLETKVNDQTDFKYCDQCLKQYNAIDTVKDCEACRLRSNLNWCNQCQLQLKVILIGNGL